VCLRSFHSAIFQSGGCHIGRACYSQRLRDCHTFCDAYPHPYHKRNANPLFKEQVAPVLHTLKLPPLAVLARPSVTLRVLEARMLMTAISLHSFPTARSGLFYLLWFYQDSFSQIELVFYAHEKGRNGKVKRYRYPCEGSAYTLV
jgi:hypothetical protein